MQSNFANHTPPTLSNSPHTHHQVHVRSVLHQGIFVTQKPFPAVTGLTPAMETAIRDTLGELTNSLKRQNVVDLAIAYVRSTPWVHKLVIGCETAEQVSENAALFGQRALTMAERDAVHDALATVLGNIPEDTLQALRDPRRWSWWEVVVCRRECVHMCMYACMCVWR